LIHFYKRKKSFEVKMINYFIGIIAAIGIGIAPILAFYPFWSVRKQRERDKDIVLRQTGPTDVDKWWRTFQEPGTELRKSEEERLRTPHNLLQHKVATRADLPFNFLGCEISLCSAERRDPFPHEHFYLMLKETTSEESSKEWKLEFDINLEHDIGEVILSQYFGKQKHKKKHSEEVTDEILDRIVSVLFATNFSYCLRNSENFANFIYFGRWQSSQLTQNKYMRKIFDQVLTLENKAKLAILPSDISEKIPVQQEIIFPELTGMLQFTGLSNLKGHQLSKNAYNIIVVGPTGAGKSTLINLLFNRTVCKIEKDNSNIASVTREACVVSGVHSCDDGEVPVNIIDTMGLCDTFLEDEEAINNLFKDFLPEHSKIDKVVFVTSGLISPKQKEALCTILDRFQYPRNITVKDVKEKKDNFVFLYNKSETLSDAEKLTALQDMGVKLGIDIGHKIPVMMLVPGMEDAGVMAQNYTNTALATSTNTEGVFDAPTKETYRKLKAALLPHTKKVLQSPKRLHIAELQCPIQ
jgi:GTP-binding protein EngB required for normal cell division